MLPTTAKISEIELGGKTVKLYFSFRAWHTLGINPLRSADVAEWFQGIDAEKAARWLAAGIAGYQALMRRLAEQDGEAAPAVDVWDVDRVLDLLDIDTLGSLIEAIGVETKVEGQPESDQPGNA